MIELKIFIVTKLCGESIDIICKVYNEVKSYKTEKKGKKILYLQLTKVLYECIQSVLLWYQTSKSCLEELDFSLHPYGSFVVNWEMNKNTRYCLLTRQ